MSTQQKFTRLECLQCDRRVYGLSNGPAENVRVSIWNNPKTTVCVKCRTQEVQALLDAEVDKYYQAKAKRNGYSE